VTNLLIIAFMIAIDVLIWQVIRTYERRGAVLAFPFVFQRDRSPRWFRFHIVMLWISLVLCILFTLFMSILLLAAGTNA
jgi:hypothetical protein